MILALLDNLLEIPIFTLTNFTTILCIAQVHDSLVGIISTVNVMVGVYGALTSGCV